MLAAAIVTSAMMITYSNEARSVVRKYLLWKQLCGEKYFQERNASSLSMYSIKQQLNHEKGGQLHSCGQLKIHCIFRGKENLVADPLESKDTQGEKKIKKIF